MNRDDLQSTQEADLVSFEIESPWYESSDVNPGQ